MPDRDDDQSDAPKPAPLTVSQAEAILLWFSDNEPKFGAETDAGFVIPILPKSLFDALFAHLVAIVEGCNRTAPVLPCDRCGKPAMIVVTSRDKGPQALCFDCHRETHGCSRD